MSIYDIDGVAQDYAYLFNGSTLVQAYDIYGNPLLGPPVKMPLNVMSYNVQWFSGINSQTAMQQKILNDNQPSIISLQELTQNGTIPAVGATVLSDYSTKILSNHKNYLGVVSKLPLYNTISADFVNQDPEDMSRYGETRAYIKTYFNFNGKKICLINSHLAVVTRSYIYAQMSELFELAQAEESVIIAADFNTNFSNFDGEYYTNTFKPFIDAGYKAVNNSPLSGITKTFCGNATAASLADFSSNPDSIIVSSNIDIDNVVFDTTKLQYLNGDKIDHIAVCATLLI